MPAAPTITYNFMDVLVEAIVLAENQQDDEGHIDVIGRAVRRIVQCLQDRNHLQ